MTTTDIPRMDVNQYADYILNHYDRNSRMDTLCLARSLIENGYGSKAEVERLSRELHLWEMGMYHKPKMQSKIDELQAEVERLRDELKKGEFVLSTMVTALENAVPWIKEHLNRD